MGRTGVRARKAVLERGLRSPIGIFRPLLEGARNWPVVRLLREKLPLVAKTHSLPACDAASRHLPGCADAGVGRRLGQHCAARGNNKTSCAFSEQHLRKGGGGGPRDRGMESVRSEPCPPV